MSILKWYMCNIITPQTQALTHTHKCAQCLYIDIPRIEANKQCMPLPPIHRLAFSAPFFV